MAEEGRAASATSDPHLETPTAYGISSMKPQLDGRFWSIDSGIWKSLFRIRYGGFAKIKLVCKWASEIPEVLARELKCIGFHRRSHQSSDKLRRGLTLDISGFKMPSTVGSAGVVPMSNPECNELGAGIYAIQCLPSTIPMPGFSSATLIPLKYNIPTRQSSGGISNEQGQEVRQQRGPQRQLVARRLQFAFQLDLGLIIKLAAMVFLFSQDGSPQKLLLLIFFATFVYLYQTGALTPFTRWLQQAAAPPPPHAPPQQQNVPPAGHDGQHNPQTPGAGDTDHLNQDQPPQNLEEVDGNQDHPHPELPANNFWHAVKEIQMFVVGFLASLLPGYHPNND